MLREQLAIVSRTFLILLFRAEYFRAIVQFGKAVAPLALNQAHEANAVDFHQYFSRAVDHVDSALKVAHPSGLDSVTKSRLSIALLHGLEHLRQKTRGELEPDSTMKKLGITSNMRKSIDAALKKKPPEGV